MKKTLLAAACCILSFSLSAQTKHTIDAVFTEWNMEKFQTDEDTRIMYSIDNDKEFIYIAVLIPAPPIQMKMVRNGMDIMFDLKGKKREGVRLAYPASFLATPPDLRASSEQEMKDKMSAMMMFYRTFGFDGIEEDKLTPVTHQGTGIQIAGGWNDSSAMLLEFAVPLAYFGAEKAAGKEISVGFKLNAPKMQGSGPMFTEAKSTTKPAGSARGNNGAFKSSNNSSAAFSAKMFEEQKFWNKYMLQ